MADPIGNEIKYGTKEGTPERALEKIEIKMLEYDNEEIEEEELTDNIRAIIDQYNKDK